MRLTIRWRLTLWITLALAALLTCFALLVYSLLQHALLAQTDQTLRSALEQLKNDPRAQTAPAQRVRYWVEEYKDHLGLSCLAYQQQTRFAWTPDLTTTTFAPEALPTTIPWTLAELPPLPDRHRVLTESVRLGHQDFLVVLCAPLTLVDRQLALLAHVLCAAGLLTLFLSAGLAWWLARQALAPMDELRRATDAITAEHLSRRLPIHNPTDELGQLTHTINTMIARLERSFAEIRRFTADASHELRTPLTALRAEVEVALGQRLSAEASRHVLESLLEELLRLSRLTAQLLTLSRRDAGAEQLVFNPLPLHEVLVGVLDTLRPLAEAQQIRLTVEAMPPLHILGDEGPLRQVFINLLDNALKYTPRHGSVSVRLEQQGATVTISVADTGSGIPPEHLPRVFERFYRVDKARTRAAGGTGLGLSIAESIVKAHGGTITLHSTVGQGTVCHVTLPITPPLPQTANLAPPS